MSFLFEGIEHDIRRCRDAILSLRARLKAEVSSARANGVLSQGHLEQLKATDEAEASLNRLAKMAEKWIAHVD